MKLDKWEGIQFVKSAWLIFHLDLKVHLLPPIKGDKKGRTWIILVELIDLVNS